jgi:hypothetical protein
MMAFLPEEPIMSTHPQRPRATVVLFVALVLASLSGCREKHEPVKPTVAVAPAGR